MGKINNGYKIRIETPEGDEKTYICKDYQHTNEGMVLSFDDKPDLVIEKSMIHRSFVGPNNDTNESASDFQINS